MKMEKANGSEDTRSVATRSTIIGVVLAGGQSRRMGRDKASLPFGSSRLIDNMVELVRSALGGEAARVVVSGEVDGQVCIPDRIGGLGPIGGLFSVLVHLEAAQFGGNYSQLLVVPVDMPALSVRSLKLLLACSGGMNEDAALFTGNELPLVIKVSDRVKKVVQDLCLDTVPGSLRSIRELLRRLDVRAVEPIGDIEAEFINANTPQEWERASGTSVRHNMVSSAQ